MRFRAFGIISHYVERDDAGFAFDASDDDQLARG
jgi:hypothetical protein